MAILDWTLFSGMLFLLLVIGYIAKKRNPDGKELYTARKKLPWYLAGTSVSATTFSSDTPILITALVITGGISANWIWWATLPGIVLTALFFAKKWRGSGVSTELEIFSKKYGDTKKTRLLRSVRAVIDGVLLNSIVLALITSAIRVISLNVGQFSDTTIIVGSLLVPLSMVDLFLIMIIIVAVGYTLVSGLLGVVLSDLFQFSLALSASFILAGYIYMGLPDVGLSLEQILNPKGSGLSLFPDFKGDNLHVFSFVLLLGLAGLHRAAGSGILVQRMIASKSDVDAVKAIYLHIVLTYFVRAWPWIFMGLVATSYLPATIPPEYAFPNMIRDFVPIGLIGIILASLWAAYISTLDSHLNWGASFIVNDLLRPLVGDLGLKITDRHLYVFSVILLVLIMLGIVYSEVLTSLAQAYQYLMVIYSGTAFVSIARWYWKSMTIEAELVGHISAFLVGNMVFFLVVSPTPMWFAVQMAINIIVSAILSIAAAVLANPKRTYISDAA